MEEKELKTPKHCLSCEYHETYYTKCATMFYKHKMGYCCKVKKVTENHDGCGEWKRKSGKGTRDFHKDIAAEVVTKMAKDILIIAQILCDDQREAQEEIK